MTPDELFEEAIRHQVALERLKATHTKDTEATAKEVAERMIAVLQTLDVENMSQINRRTFSGILTDLGRMELGAWDKWGANLLKLSKDLAGQESKAAPASLSKVVKKKVASLSPAKTYEAVLARPLTATGELLEPFIKGLPARAVKNTNQVLQRAWNEGWTIQQSVQSIRGTKARQFKDGTTALNTRQAESIARTAIQHVAHAAREAFYEENDDLVTGYRWMSTLDGRTTSQCRSLDGRIFEIGKGPLPPLHIRCRSTTVPDLDDAFDFLDEGATRSSENGYVDGGLNYYQWLRKQPVEYIRSVLGKSRTEMFLAPDMTPERFSDLQLDKFFQPLTVAELRGILDRPVDTEPPAAALAAVTTTMSEVGQNGDTVNLKTAAWSEEQADEFIYRSDKLDYIDDVGDGTSLYSNPMTPAGYDYDELPTGAKITTVEADKLRKAGFVSTQVVAIKDLSVTQDTLGDVRLKSALTQAFDPSKGRPLIVKAQGKLYILDGHHRTAAEQLKGATGITADVLDWDAAQGPAPIGRVGMPGRGATRDIWLAADQLEKELGREPSRAEVIARTRAQGINESTASTQYAKWKKAAKQPSLEPEPQPGPPLPRPGMPKSGSTREVWVIADQLSQQLGREPTRAEVVARAVELGINSSTAGTQFGAWKKAGAAPKPPVAIVPKPLPVDPRKQQREDIKKRVDAYLASSASAPTADDVFNAARKKLFEDYKDVTKLERDFYDFREGRWKPGVTLEQMARLQEFKAKMRKISEEHSLSSLIGSSTPASSRAELTKIITIEPEKRGALAINAGNAEDFDGVPERLEAAVALFESHVSPSIIDKLGVIHTNVEKGIRAHYKSWSNGIHISETGHSSTTSTIVHEIAHAIEYKVPDISERSKAFLKQRAGGAELKKLSKLTGSNGYRDDEVAYEDEWVKRGGDHYMGKWYDSKATELITMGIERLIKDPVDFALKDREYFDFMVYTLLDIYE